MDFLQFLSSAGAAALISSMMSIITWALNTRRQQKKHNDKIIIALRALFCNEIRKKAKVYITRGYITVEEFADIEQMNTIYKENLNGNGYIKTIMDKIETLPVKKEKEIIKGA